MTSKHYRWQVHWAASLAHRCAVHDSGAVVDFRPVDTPARELVGDELHTLCGGPPGGLWVGHWRGGEADKAAWLVTQPALRDPASQAGRLRRLLTEAAKMYTQALRKEDPP